MGKVDSSTILAKINSDADSTSRFTVIDKPIRGILDVGNDDNERYIRGTI